MRSWERLALSFCERKCSKTVKELRSYMHLDCGADYRAYTEDL